MYKKNIDKILKELKSHKWGTDSRFRFLTSYDDSLLAQDLLEDLKGYSLETADQLSDAIQELADTSTDVYTSDLIKWLNDNNYSVNFTDEALKEYGPFDSIDKVLMVGQFLQNMDMLNNLRPLIEQEDDD